MASDGESAQPAEDDPHPDERAVIAERAGDLEELDEDEYLDLEAVADSLGIDLDRD